MPELRLVDHGDSATTRGDYSLGAHAAVIRDLLSALGIGRATIVGHSFGGGVAMVFFWQFPHLVERLGLVSSGGLGPEVSPLLRSVAVPGASALISLAGADRVTGALDRAGTTLRARGSGLGVQLQAIARALRPLGGPGAREAFVHTLRAVIDARGQRVGAADRLYLLEAVPTLIAWGERDRTIPIEHGRAAHAAVPHSRFVELAAEGRHPAAASADVRLHRRGVGRGVVEVRPARARGARVGERVAAAAVGREDLLAAGGGRLDLPRSGRRLLGPDQLRADQQHRDREGRDEPG